MRRILKSSTVFDKLTMFGGKILYYIEFDAKNEMQSDKYTMREKIKIKYLVTKQNEKTRIDVII